MEEKEAEKNEERKEEREKRKTVRTCPFWKGECHTDCMLYIARIEKMTAKCAFSVIASQLEAGSLAKTAPPGLSI